VSAWDPAPGGGALHRVRAFAFQGETIFVGGDFGLIGGSARDRMAAIDLSSGRVNEWKPTSNGSVFALAAAGDVLYAAGQFTEIGGRQRNGLAALDLRSGEATSWDPHPEGEYDYFTWIQTLAVDGPLVRVGGYFARIGGEARNNIAAIDRATGRATPWQTTLGSQSGWVPSVSSLAIGEGKVFVSGSGFLDAVDATTGARVWSHDWPVEQTVGNVTELALGNGVLYTNGLGGHLTALDAASGVKLSRALDTPDGLVTALILRGNVLYVGGDFLNCGKEQRNNLAALDVRTGALLD